MGGQGREGTLPPMISSNAEETFALRFSGPRWRQTTLSPSSNNPFTSRADRALHDPSNLPPILTNHIHKQAEKPSPSRLPRRKPPSISTTKISHTRSACAPVRSSFLPHNTISNSFQTLHRPSADITSVSPYIEALARKEMAAKAGGKGPLNTGQQGIKKSGKK